MTHVAYSTYAETGTEWLGKVPSHWTRAPLGQFFNERKQIVSDAEYRALSVTKAGIVPQLETAAKTDNGDNRKRVSAGDFVINSRSDRKGSAGVSGHEGSVSLISTVLTPKGMDSRFVHNLLRSRGFQEEYFRFGTGIVADLWSTRYTQMRQIVLAVPPLDEQRQIADYLDRETSKIDELIAKQEQLVATLTERTRSVVLMTLETSQAPTTPLKHLWKVVDCKHITAEFAEYGFPVASIRETEGRHLDLTGAKRTTKQFYDALIDGDRQPQAGDLIFTRNATVGRVSEVPQGLEPFAIGQDVCLLKSTGKMLPRFAQLILESTIGTDQLDLAMVGSTFKRVNVEQVRSMLIPAPPLSEQSRIVNQLDSEIASRDALVSKARRMTALLRERRAALISAAVTGKIDVSSQHPEGALA